MTNFKPLELRAAPVSNSPEGPVTPLRSLYAVIAALLMISCFVSGSAGAGPREAPAPLDIPKNEAVVRLPAAVRVCLADGFRTAEIAVKGGYSLTAFPAGQGRKPVTAAGEGMKLAVKRIVSSKPAVVKYYAVLRTFPYSHAFRDDKKTDVERTLSELAEAFGGLELFTYGCVLKSAGGSFSIDVRTLFAARGPFAGEAECRAFCDRARAERKLPAFVHPVRFERPECVFDASFEPALAGAASNIPGGPDAFKGLTRVEVAASGEVMVRDMEFGRGDSWHDFKDARYRGTIEISADNAGLMQIVNETGFDELLKVVVPSEIEPRSPYQAVCAQAVAARSEVLAKFKTRHTESDYDFCASTHCQAYGGLANRRPDCDRAVEETSGKIVFSNGHIVDTVYHANCGGVTEDSNKIWSAPFDGALTKVNDSTLEAALELATNEAALRSFILKPPPSYCSVEGACANPDKFRWRREFSQGQIDEMVKKQFDIGRLESIEVLARGASGRVIAIELKGSKKSEKVYKELPIRKLFGMLRSSLFIVEAAAGPAGEKRFVFRGAGWGHGVGMCQDGAKGMAIHGRSYEEILLHYYSNSKIVNFN